MFHFLLILPLFAAGLDVKTHSEAALVINAETGAALYEKKSKEKFSPASITKVITALYALKKKKDSLNEMVTASNSSIVSISAEKKKTSGYTLPSWWIDVGSTHMGIKAGETLSFEALLHGLLITSANDAANVIAEWVSGSVPAFVEELNGFAKEIGMRNSHFTNPHGNHHPEQYTTAEDMAILTREFLKEPLLRKIVSTVVWKRPETNKQESVSLLQSNKLLRKGTDYYYPKAIGVKTGTGEVAKHNLISAAEDKERTLIAVTLKADTKKESYEDAIALFEAAFNQPKVTKVYFPAGKKSYLAQIPGGKKASPTYTRAPLTQTHFRFDEPKLIPYLEWRLDLTAPLESDQEVGDLVLKNEKGEIVVTVPLYTEEKIQPTLSFRLKRLLRGEAAASSYLILLACFLALLFLMKKLRR